MVEGRLLQKNPSPTFWCLSFRLKRHKTSTIAVFSKIHANMGDLSTGAGQMPTVLIMFWEVLGQEQFHEQQAHLST